MDLSTILAISGKPGLCKSVAQTKNGLIVESLIDGKRFPVFTHERMSSLAEISVFAVDEDVPLDEVLKKIYEKYDGKPAISPSSKGDQLKAFMKEVMPNYDEDRVYTSDIKKILTWYNLLAEKEMLDFTEEPEEDKSEAGTEEKPADSKDAEPDDVQPTKDKT